ncbi:helix-loop-helix DNA-binding protein, partial [Backusella circina FSU 941]
MLPQAAPNTTPADLREQARKVSHSAIEKRRRERINDKIIQLKELIPSCAAQENIHKMSILQSAIDYITYLKDIVKSLEDDSETSS